MAVKMVVFWFSLVLFIVGSQAAGEFDVIHSPRSLRFSGASRAYESLLKEIFSASLGLSVEEDAEWDGLLLDDPFATPEAVVEVYVDGVSSLENVVPKAHSFPLYVDQYEPDTFEAIKHRIQQRFGAGANKLIKLRLSDANDLANFSSIFGDLTQSKIGKMEYEHLKLDVEEDFQFLSELAVLKAITSKVLSGVIVPDNIIDFYYFRFQSLHPLTDFHGPNSLQVKEAKMILGQAIADLSNAFVKAYHGSVLVATVATDVAHTRRVRAAPPQPAPALRDLSGEAFSDDYAPIFNILLWFGLVYVFALVAIVHALANMDPGRDSIIYRMTNPRMKKDN